MPHHAQPRQRLVFGWASDRKLKQMASQAANGFNMYAMWQKGWTESEVCACNLNMWNSFLCLSFVVEKWFLFIGKQTCHFLLVDFLFIFFQPFGEARQRKGKVPNNPPDIDVDLPVRAWWFFKFKWNAIWNNDLKQHFFIGFSADTLWLFLLGVLNATYPTLISSQKIDKLQIFNVLDIFKMVAILMLPPTNERFLFSNVFFRLRNPRQLLE